MAISQDTINQILQSLNIIPLIGEVLFEREINKKLRLYLCGDHDNLDEILVVSNNGDKIHYFDASTDFGCITGLKFEDVEIRLNKIIQYFPHINDLNLARFVFVLPTALISIKQLSKLEHLNLEYTQVNDETIENIIPHLPLLRTIELSYNCQLTDRTLKCIGDAIIDDTLQNLISISMECCNITNDGIIAIANEKSQLMYIDFAHCLGISIDWLPYFKKMPNLNTLNLCGIDNINKNYFDDIDGFNFIV